MKKIKVTPYWFYLKFFKIITIPEFKTKLEYGAALVPTEDLEIGLIMLFSYYELPKFYKALQNHFNKE